MKILNSALRSDGSALRRFRDEIRLARRIAHPNVCRIFDLFVEQRGPDELAYFTMEFLPGITLAQRMVERGAFGIEDGLGIARQIASGLDAAHRLGIIHRDLKAANILLVPESSGAERAVITDFGLAKMFVGGLSLGETLTGQVVGTPNYMAPEQFLESQGTPATAYLPLGCCSTNVDGAASVSRQ